MRRWVVFGMITNCFTRLSVAFTYFSRADFYRFTFFAALQGTFLPFPGSFIDAVFTFNFSGNSTISPPFIYLFLVFFRENGVAPRFESERTKAPAT